MKTEKAFKTQFLCQGFESKIVSNVSFPQYTVYVVDKESHVNLDLPVNEELFRLITNMDHSKQYLEMELRIVSR